MNNISIFDIIIQEKKACLLQIQKVLPIYTLYVPEVLSFFFNIQILYKIIFEKQSWHYQ